MGKVGGVDPALWLNWKNIRYAVNQVSKTFSQAQNFSRSSTGTFTNSALHIALAAINDPRFTYVTRTRGLLNEEQRSTATNNLLEGAALGSNGTYPTGWSMTYNPGDWNVDVVGLGEEYGQPYIDLRFHGNTVASEGILRFDKLGGVTADEAYTSSFYITKIAGSTDGIPVIDNRMSYYNSTFGYLSEGHTSILNKMDGERHMTAFTGTTPTDTGWCGAVLALRASEVGRDITLRIQLPQVEKGSFRTSHILNGADTSTTRLGDKNDIILADVGIDASKFSDGVTLYFEYELLGDLSYNTIFELASDTYDDRIYAKTGGGTFRIIKGGAQTANISVSPTIGKHKVAARLKDGDVAYYMDGVQIGTSAASIPTSLIKAYIGHYFDGTGQNAKVFYDGQIILSPLTNDECAELTTL